MTPWVCELSKTGFCPSCSHQLQVKTHMSLTLMENLPCDSWSGRSKQACDSEGGQAELPLHREEVHSGATLPTRSSPGLHGPPLKPPPVASLKGGRHQLVLAQLGGNNSRISGIWKWSSCRDRLGLQPLTPTPALSDQLLTKPGKQEAVERLAEGKTPCFLASASQTLQVRAFFSSADLPVCGARGLTEAGNSNAFHAFIHFSKCLQAPPMGQTWAGTGSTSSSSSSYVSEKNRHPPCLYGASALV